MTSLLIGRFKILVLILTLLSFSGTSMAGSGDDEHPLDYTNENEASAALLFLELYNQGLAGGKSGVCVDLDYDVDGKPQFKAAFDTDAFVTGKSSLKDVSDGGQTFNSDNFKKLIDAIAKVQNGKVDISVDGYADGQHYNVADEKKFSVDESIRKNETLSAGRANTIADLIKTNPNANVTEVRGHASPYWEKKYPGMKNGLNCPTRRKVVVTFDQPSPSVKSEMSGSFFRAPESMNKTVKDHVLKEFREDVRDARKSLNIDVHKRNMFDKRPDRADVDKIYAKLKKDKKLNPKCDLPPFKQMTLAMIEFEMTIYGKNASGKKEEIIEEYMKESGFDMKDISGGRSALQEGCLVPSEKLASEMQTSVKDYAVSGSSFTKSAGLKTNNGSVNVGFDVKTLSPQKVPAGEHKNETLRGFFCKACGNGLFFEEDPKNKDKFVPEYIDRVVNFKGNDQQQASFIKNLNEVSKQDPFSIASYVKPRLFVVKNCKDCKCDHTSLIRNNDPSVITFDPISGGPTSAQIPSNEFNDACVIRPPVHHACNVDPNKNNGKDKHAFQQKLTYESSIQNLKFSAENMDDLITKVGNSCSDDKKNMTVDKKISDVMCSADKLKKLPSGDGDDSEQEDCAEFNALKGK